MSVYRYSNRKFRNTYKIKICVKFISHYHCKLETEIEIEEFFLPPPYAATVLLGTMQPNCYSFYITLIHATVGTTSLDK